MADIWDIEQYMQCQKTKKTNNKFPDAPNGLELRQKIRAIDPRAYIVFITSHSEMAYMTMEYHLEALNYIPKLNWDIVKGKIFYCMQTAHERQLKAELSAN